MEHILPQNPADESQWCKDFSMEGRNTWTDRLGNLVLISGRKNSAQGREDFASKKVNYFKKNIETFPNSLRVLNTNTAWTAKELQDNHTGVLDTLKTYIEMCHHNATVFVRGNPATGRHCDPARGRETPQPEPVRRRGVPSDEAGRLLPEP